MKLFILVCLLPCLSILSKNIILSVRISCSYNDDAIATVDVINSHNNRAIRRRWRDLTKK